MSFYSFSHGGITYLLLNLFLDTCFFMYMILNIHFLLLLYKTLFLYVNVESRDCIKLLLTLLFYLSAFCPFVSSPSMFHVFFLLSAADWELQCAVEYAW